MKLFAQAFLLIALSAAAFGQCGKLALNPVTGELDCTGLLGSGVTITSPNGTITVGGTATAPTLDTVATANGTCPLAAATTCSITLTGVAAKAVWSCYDNSGATALIPDTFVITTDTLTFNFSAPATGYCNASTGVGLTGATGATGAAGAAGPISATGGSGTELQYRAGATTLGAVTGSSVSGANLTLGGTLAVGTSLSVDGTTGIAATSKLANVALNTLTGITKLAAGVPSVAAASDIPQSGTSGGIPYYSSASAIGSSAAWTVNTLMKGGGAGTTPTVTGITVDSSNNLTTPGTVSAGGATIGGTCVGCAGVADFTQGTLPGSFPSNSFSMYSPTSIATSYQWRLPTADAAGAIVSDGGGTPGVLSIVGFSGSGNINRGRLLGGAFDGGGSALSSGATTYFTFPYACTIVAWNITVDTGTATFKLWRKATGTAIPTVSDSINTNGVAISTGTAVHSTTVSDFISAAIAANDIIAVNLTTVSGATKASLVTQCQ